MIEIIHARVEGFTLEDNLKYPIGQINGARSMAQAAYAFGDAKPNYPVPATIRVSWLLSLDYAPVVIHREGNIEYAVTHWV